MDWQKFCTFQPNYNYQIRTTPDHNNHHYLGALQQLGHFRRERERETVSPLDRFRFLAALETSALFFFLYQTLTLVSRSGKRTRLHLFHLIKSPKNAALARSVGYSQKWKFTCPSGWGDYLDLPRSLEMRIFSIHCIVVRQLWLRILFRLWWCSTLHTCCPKLGTIRH